MPNNKQKAKSILITGCSTGIGRATAMHFSELGYQVFAGVRRETDAASLIEEDRFTNIHLVTTEAKVALFLHWLLPDKVMDAFVAAQMK